jgi:UDP-glucose 4-epimerase
MSPDSSIAPGPAALPRVLVTGGRGRIARALWDDLEGKAWAITRCSRTASDGFIAQEDILMSAGPLDVEAIVHCAWSTVPATAEKLSPADLAQDHTLLRRWIARAESAPKPPLFIFISTIAVYGETPLPAVEHSSHPLPKGAYASAKLTAEQIVQASRLDTCVLRVSPLYGLGDADSQQGVIAHLIKAAKPGQTFTQWGDDSEKDYLHRADFTEALRRIVAQRLHDKLPYNLGSGQPSKLTSLVTKVGAAMHCDIPTNRIEAPPWDVRQNLVDITRLTDALKWKPSRMIDQGIAEAVRTAQSCRPGQ